MHNLELVTLITYICGILGGILLLLCIILAFIFIVWQCRRYFCSSDSQYSIVPISQNGGSVIENGFVHRKGSIPGDDPHQIPLLCSENEDGSRNNKKKPRVIKSKNDSHSQAPVKKKLLWKKGRKKSITRMPADRHREDEKVEFSDDDLDVPRDRIFRRNPAVIKFKSRSKSDWDIHDLPGDSPMHSSEEDFAMNVLHKRLQPNDDIGISQYFDALETINEAEEEALDEEFLSDKDPKAPLLRPHTQLMRFQSQQRDLEEWEDINTLEEIPEETSGIQMKRFIKDSHHLHQKRSRDPKVKRRLKALHRLQLQGISVAAQFYRDVARIEAKYLTSGMTQPLETLKRVVSGADPKFQDGIPRYWLIAMIQCDTLGAIIQDYDHEVLNHLMDVRIRPYGQISSKRDKFGFVIQFEFEQNEFFTNEILSKEYEVRCRPNLHRPFTFEGSEIADCKGCKIQWKKGKNVTLKPVKKSVEGETVQKWAKRNSFFNFFTPPALTKEILKDDAKAKLMQAHFEIGLHIKDTFLPNSIGFFLDWNRLAGSHENLRRKRLPSERMASQLLKSGKPRPHATASSSKQNKEHNKPQPAPLGSYAESELSEVSHAEHGIKSPPEEPPLVEQPKGPDPIIGRYRLTSSEGFDEVLKDLNVGMMKRKMANSVTPVNVIEILEDGTYVIRTETTLRTSEIRFKLNETFVEATLDGRNTQTFPTRQGNVIHLDQIGDSKKKEKDSVMTRDFQGDVMYMELIVGKTISKRVYERIVNE